MTWKFLPTKERTCERRRDSYHLPKPQHRDDVIAAFLDVIPSVHYEPGCELYALNEGKDRLVMIEQWESREALAVHGRLRR